MSPSKSSKKPQKTQKTLTIDFAGICTFVWNKKAGTAEMRLVDLASAGFQRHYSALGIAVNERTPKVLKGPEADAAMSLPDSNTDLGLWNLSGCDVEIVGATGKLSVDDTKVDVTKKPGKTAESVRWLADIGYLTGSTDPNGLCPTSATVTDRRGPADGQCHGRPSPGVVLRERHPDWSDPLLRAARARRDSVRRRAGDRARPPPHPPIQRFDVGRDLEHVRVRRGHAGDAGPLLRPLRRRPREAAAGGHAGQAAPGGGAVAMPHLASWPEFCYMGFVEP